MHTPWDFTPQTTSPSHTLPGHHAHGPRRPIVTIGHITHNARGTHGTDLDFWSKLPEVDTMTTTITIGPTQRATIIALIDATDSDLRSLLTFMHDSGGGVTITPSGRIATAAYITRARTTLSMVRSLFTRPSRASAPSCPSQSSPVVEN